VKCVLVDGVGNWIGYEARSEGIETVNVPHGGGMVAFERTGEVAGGLVVFRQEGCGQPPLRREKPLAPRG
jgi:hypothetical protein